MLKTPTTPLSSTLSALVNTEIPENVRVVTELLDEVFRARDHLQELLLKLGSMLHGGKLDRGKLDLGKLDRAELTAQSAPVPKALTIPTRDDDPIPPAKILAIIKDRRQEATARTKKGDKQPRRLRFTVIEQEEIYAWVKQQYQKYGAYAPITRSLQLSRNVLYSWATKHNKNEKIKKTAKAKKPEAPKNALSHGISGYTRRGCRCDVCFAAKQAQNQLRYRKIKNARQAETSQKSEREIVN